MKFYYYYKETIKFPYKFIMESNPERPTGEERKEVLEWVRENCGLYNKDHIYWGLKDRKVEPCWLDSDSEIQFKTEEYATAFKLRWM